MSLVPKWSMYTKDVQPHATKIVTMTTKGETAQISELIGSLKVTTDTSDVPRNTFLGLPLETRLQIYENLISKRGNLLTKKGRPFHFSILAVSRQINTEAKPVLYSRLGFEIWNPSQYQNELVLSPPIRYDTALQYTKHLCLNADERRIGCDTKQHLNPDRLRSAFPNVETITIIANHHKLQHDGWVQELSRFCVSIFRENCVSIFGENASLKELSVVDTHDDPITQKRLNPHTASWFPSIADRLRAVDEREEREAYRPKRSEQRAHNWAHCQPGWTVESAYNTDKYSSPYLSSFITLGIHNIVLIRRVSDET